MLFLLLFLSSALPLTTRAGTVLDASSPPAEPETITNLWEVGEGEAKPEEPPAQATLDLSTVYSTDVPGERLEERGLEPEWGAGVPRDAGDAIVSAFLITNREPRPKPTPVARVESRAPSTVWTALKSVPPSGAISMLFCVFLLALLLLKGMRP
ncbi:MAG: hypothetical protein FJ225_10610 [Lentisphaerae bacterium]|nr:hypothetical protein [Lentisphaerota bacterium]